MTPYRKSCLVWCHCQPKNSLRNWKRKGSRNWRGRRSWRDGWVKLRDAGVLASSLRLPWAQRLPQAPRRSCEVVVKSEPLTLSTLHSPSVLFLASLIFRGQSNYFSLQVLFFFQRFYWFSPVQNTIETGNPPPGTSCRGPRHQGVLSRTLWNMQY